MKTGFIDIIALVLMVFMLLPHKPDEGARSSVRAGLMNVCIEWLSGSNTDVDLWVLAPEESRPVGFTHKRGRYFALWRDDQGFSSSKYRGECASVRDIPDGEYQASVHLYRIGRNERPPIRVRVWITLQREDDNGNLSPEEIVAQREVELLELKEEVTALRWRMLDGHIVRESINHAPREIVPVTSFMRALSMLPAEDPGLLGGVGGSGRESLP